MERTSRRTPLRFSTQMLLLQLGVVALVVLLSSAVHAWLSYDRLGREAENQALTLARTVASDPSVRAEVQSISALPAAPPAAELLAGPLMAAAEGARARTGALFVVITDETGIRLAHPDAERLGEKVSTDPSEALAGKEVTTRNTGTLGPSAGAKVPVFASGSPAVVGEVERRLLHGGHRPKPRPGHHPHCPDRSRSPDRRSAGVVPAATAAAAADAGTGTGGNQHPCP